MINCLIFSNLFSARIFFLFLTLNVKPGFSFHVHCTYIPILLSLRYNHYLIEGKKCKIHCTYWHMYITYVALRLPLTNNISIFSLQSTTSINRTRTPIFCGSHEGMNRNISPIINFDALLIRDLSRINTSKYFLSRVRNLCLLFQNKYGIWLTID